VGVLLLLLFLFARRMLEENPIDELDWRRRKEEGGGGAVFAVISSW